MSANDAGLNIVIGADVKAAVDGIDKVADSADKLGEAAGGAVAPINNLTDNVNKITPPVKEAGITIADMREKLKQLKAELETTTGGDNIRKLNVEIKGLEDAIKGATTVAEPARESFEKMRTVFEDVGHVIEGRDITIRSFAQNFSLVGPAVAIAAAAIAFLGKELYDYISEADAAEQAQKILNKTLGDSGASVQGEIASIGDLIDIIKDETNSRQLRNDAFQQLQDKYPNALKNMSLEKNSLADVTDATNKLTAALIRQAEIKGLEGAIAQVAKEEADLMNQTATGFISSLNVFDKLKLALSGGSGVAGALGTAEGAADLLGEKFEGNNAKTDALNKKLKELLTTSLKLGDLKLLGKDTGGGGKQDNSIEELQKYIDDSAKINADAYQKEIIAENEKYKKIYDDLTAFHHDTEAATEQHQKNLAEIEKKYSDKDAAAVAGAFAAEKAKELKALLDGNANLTAATNSYLQKSQEIGKSATEKAIAEENAKYAKLKEAHMLGDGQIEEIEIQHQKNLESITKGGEDADAIRSINIRVNEFKFNFDKHLASDGMKKAVNEVLQHIKEAERAGDIQVALNLSANINAAAKQQFLKDIQSQIGELIVRASAATIEGIGTVIGNIASGVKNPFDSVLKTIGGLLGDGLIEIGKEIIEASTIMATIQEAVSTLGTAAGPELGVLAGIAAIAAGTILKNAVTTKAAHAFATGGIITSPTVGLVGEAGPEAIFPLSKINDFVQSTQGAGGYIPDVKLKGADMIIAFKRATKQENLV